MRLFATSHLSFESANKADEGASALVFAATSMQRASHAGKSTMQARYQRLRCRYSARNSLQLSARCPCAVINNVKQCMCANSFVFYIIDRLMGFNGARHLPLSLFFHFIQLNFKTIIFCETIQRAELLQTPLFHCSPKRSRCKM